MGVYQLSLHGSDRNDDSSRGSSNGSNKSSRSEKQKDSAEAGGHHHNFFQSGRAQNLHSPPRHSTACYDVLSERREIERRLSTIVPLQDFHCMGQSFRSEDSESLALWEEKEQPAASNDHGWMKLTKQSPRWLDAMRKFDTMKLAPWRSSPVHPKTSLDVQRLSLSDKRGSIKSFHESSKAPWYSTKIGNGESQSVRSPLGASILSRQSGELIPSSGELSIPPARRGELNRSDGSKHGNSSRKDTQFITEEDTGLSSAAVARDISSTPELVVKKECLVHGVTSGIPADGMNVVQTERAREEVTKNPTPYSLEISTMNAESVTDNKSASRNSAGKEQEAMETSTCEADRLPNKTSAVHEKEDEAYALASIKCEAMFPLKIKEEAPVESEGDETPATEVTSCKASQPSQRLAMPSSEQDDDASPYEALRQRYILKSESEPLDGNLYVIQPRTLTSATSRAQSVITNPKDEEADMSSESCLLKSRSSNDAEGHSSRVEASSTPERLFASLRSKVFRSSTRPSPSLLGKKKNLGDFSESTSPRSILCGLADEGSLPSSNPSQRSDPEMSAFSALPPSASQYYSSSGASFDLNDHDFEVTRSGYNLNAPKAVESRRVSLSFRDFGGPSRPSRENAASKVDAAAALEAAPNTELLRCEDQLPENEGRSSTERILTPELWTATFSTDVQNSHAQPGSPCAATERESAFLPCNTPPERGLSYMSPSELEEQQMSSGVSRSRSLHNDFTARLGGMFSPQRLISKCDDGVSSNRHNCFVASSTLSPPRDDNLGDLSPAYDTLELLSPAASSSLTKERKSKSKSQFSNRRHSSADSSDAPTMMVRLLPCHGHTRFNFLSFLKD